MVLDESEAAGGFEVVEGGGVHRGWLVLTWLGVIEKCGVGVGSWELFFCFVCWL